MLVGPVRPVIDYSHRDRRAHRDVWRALWMMIGAAVALTGFALVLPHSFAGPIAVLALGVVGALYLGWSDTMLTSYTDDLRLAREGRETDGFVRVEVMSPVGLYRTTGRPTEVSPHSRRRYRGTGTNEDGRSADDGTDPDQL